jgi:hypothetical protein
MATFSRFRNAVRRSSCPEGAKQVSPGQSEAAQPPSAALGKRPTPHVRRPEGAKQIRDKRATNTRQTRHKCTKSCVEIIQMSESYGTWLIRCHSSLPIEDRESRSSIYIRFAMVRDHIPFSVLSCPFGAMDLGGLATQGGASRRSRDALPWANLSLPLRGARTVAPRRPGAEETAMPQSNGSASRNRPAPKGQNRLAQGRARRRGRRAPPWVNGQPRTFVALKGQYKHATNAPQTHEIMRRNDSNVGITRNAADSLPCVVAHRSLRIEAIHLHPVRNGS